MSVVSTGSMLADAPVLAIDTADIGGVVAPIAVIGACLVIIVISVIVRRVRQGRATPDGPPGAETAAPAGSDWNQPPTDLGAWQTDHGHSVDRWLDAHEGSLPTLVPGADPAIDAELDRAMADAATACPNPEVSALLTGMRTSAQATRTALTGGDRQGAEAAHDEYGRHRSAAIESMQGTAPPDA